MHHLIIPYCKITTASTIVQIMHHKQTKMLIVNKTHTYTVIKTLVTKFYSMFMYRLFYRCNKYTRKQ